MPAAAAAIGAVMAPAVGAAVDHGLSAILGEDEKPKPSSQVDLSRDTSIGGNLAEQNKGANYTPAQAPQASADAGLPPPIPGGDGYTPAAPPPTEGAGAAVSDAATQGMQQAAAAAQGYTPQGPPLSGAGPAASGGAPGGTPGTPGKPGTESFGDFASKYGLAMAGSTAGAGLGFFLRRRAEDRAADRLAARESRAALMRAMQPQQTKGNLRF